MRITFGNATVKRLESERELAERLNHLRFFTITACLLRIHHGHALRDIAAWLHLSLRTVYNWLIDWKSSTAYLSVATVVGMRVHRLEMHLRQEVKRAGGKWSPPETGGGAARRSSHGVRLGSGNGILYDAHERILDYISRTDIGLCLTVWQAY